MAKREIETSVLPDEKVQKTYELKVCPNCEKVMKIDVHLPRTNCEYCKYHYDSFPPRMGTAMSFDTSV